MEQMAETRETYRGRYLMIDGVEQSLRVDPRAPYAPLTGAAWDVLALARFLVQEAGEPGKALFLGVGGGTVPRLIRHFESAINCPNGTWIGHILNPWRFYGVEADPSVLEIACSQFDLMELGWETVRCMSAATYLSLVSVVDKYAPTQGFDVIFDDLFTGAYKPKDHEEVLEMVLAQTPRLLVSNTLTPDEYPLNLVTARFPHVLKVTLPTLHNTFFFAGELQRMTERGVRGALPWTLLHPNLRQLRFEVLQ